MTKSLYYHAGTGKTFEVDDAFASKFVGLEKVEAEEAAPEPTPEPTKPSTKTKSSKEGTK